MGDSTIEWTDKTWNPVTGCDRVSPGCDNCYALTLAGRLKAMGSKRYQNDGDPRTSGPGFGLTLHPDRLSEPLVWQKPKRVFVNSMSDLFHPKVPWRFIAEVWEVMGLAERHQFQILTKRPQRMSELLRLNPPRFPVLPNVWLGTSIESNRYAFRANHLRKTPAAVRFLSIEPLLGPVDSLNLEGIDWVIVGGESGPGARPMHPDWVREIRDRCQKAGVPFFFKQWGGWQEGSAPNRNGAWLLGEIVLYDGSRWPWYGIEKALDNADIDPGAFQRMRPTVMARVGKHKAGRELDGRTWDEYPVPMAVA